MLRTEPGALGRLSIAIAVIAVAAPAWAVDPAQADDFEDGTTMGWEEGAPSPNPPLNVSTGGPGGVDDNYLENSSSGGGGPGSRMAFYNRAQWAGDYNGAGVTHLRAHAANFGASPIPVRVAVEGAGGGRFASTDAVMLPADGMWYSVIFALTDAEMTLVEGSQSLASALDDIYELRFLASASAAWRGDAMVATLGVDNIAVESPIFGDGFESQDTSGWDIVTP